MEIKGKVNIVKKIIYLKFYEEMQGNGSLSIVELFYYFKAVKTYLI